MRDTPRFKFGSISGSTVVFNDLSYLKITALEDFLTDILMQCHIHYIYVRH